MVRGAKFEISHTLTESTLVLSIAGELDLRTVPTLTQAVHQHLVEGVTTMTLDLRDLAFMDSSGLRLLISLHDRSLHEPWRLRLIRPKHEGAVVVLRVTGADVALPFEPQDVR
jgi:anti-anti-sigma factor